VTKIWDNPNPNPRSADPQFLTALFEFFTGLYYGWYKEQGAEKPDTSELALLQNFPTQILSLTLSFALTISVDRYFKLSGGEVLR